MDQTTASKAIHAWISESLDHNESDTDVLRASAASGCVRKRWYKHKGYKSEKLQPRAIITFALGDVVEHVFKNFIERALVGKFYSEVDFGQKTGKFTIQHRDFDTYAQETVMTTIGDLKIPGHCDGWGKRSEDGEWELIEIKSSATFGFDRFVAGEVPDYIKQVHCLLMSDKATKLQARSARFFYMDKNASHIHDRLFFFSLETASIVKNEFLESVATAIPNRPYELVDETFRSKPTGRKVLPWQCSYCSYNKECWPGIKLEISKAGKPIWYMS